MHPDFYCICCKRTVPADLAEKTFKTGFYRNIPLGICRSCGKIDYNAFPNETRCVPARAN